MNNPSPADILQTRTAAGLTQTAAAALLHTTCRTWQQWEASATTKSHRKMHPAFYELFCLKTAQLRAKP